MQKNQSIIFFKKQNILLRKKIRENDLKIASKAAESCSSRNVSGLNDINFLVVGPTHSGKTSIIKLLHYALNSNHNLNSIISKDGSITYKKYEIKNNQRNKIKGVTTLDKSDQKLGITAFEIEDNCKDLNIKYRKALDVLGLSQLTCLNCFVNEVAIPQNKKYSYVLICISVVEKIQRQELIGLKFLIEELQERKLGFRIIGTKSNLVKGANKTEQNEYYERWKSTIMKELHIKDSNGVIYIGNQLQSEEQAQQNCFYALNLLNKIVESGQKNLLQRSKSQNFFTFFPFQKY